MDDILSHTASPTIRHLQRRHETLPSLKGLRFSFTTVTPHSRGCYETRVAAAAARTFSHLSGGSRPRLTSSRRVAASPSAALAVDPKEKFLAGLTGLCDGCRSEPSRSGTWFHLRQVSTRTEDFYPLTTNH